VLEAMRAARPAAGHCLRCGNTPPLLTDWTAQRHQARTDPEPPCPPSQCARSRADAGHSGLRPYGLVAGTFYQPEFERVLLSWRGSTMSGCCSGTPSPIWCRATTTPCCRSQPARARARYGRSSWSAATGARAGPRPARRQAHRSTYAQRWLVVDAIVKDTTSARSASTATRAVRVWNCRR
jgi:hypothetical protein